MAGALKREYPFVSLELNLEANGTVCNRRTFYDVRPTSLEAAFFDNIPGTPCICSVLLCGTGDYRPKDPDHVFAALAVRVLLDPCLNDQSTRLARTAVNQHLRLFIALDQSSGVLKTTTASEPVLADAVASVLILGCGA